jgi:hypothetical protein
VGEFGVAGGEVGRFGAQVAQFAAVVFEGGIGNGHIFSAAVNLSFTNDGFS